jgi:hypothetical protein
MKIIRAQGRTNRSLQLAVDQVARAGGGVVEIPRGTYRLHDALHLRSGVRLVGESGAILQKVPSVESALVPWIGFGQYEFAVAEPRKFAVGMGVVIGDKNSFGFYETAATIIGRKGDLFFIDRPLAHDYTPKLGGRVISVFPLLSCRHADDVVIRNLILDGNSTRETRAINGCRGGGVYLQYSNRVTIESVEVRNFRGDAISFQQSTDVIVRDCWLHHNTGGGLHPGSGTVRYVMAGNHIEHNGGCGVFYCLRTQYSHCDHNHIHHNGGPGISVGERDTDHRLAGNRITDNRGPGLFFREPFWESGDRVWIEGNTLARNGGPAEIVLERDIHQLCVTGNTLEPLTGAALQVGPGCAEIYFAGNSCSTVAGKAIRKMPARFPRVGPGAAPRDAARHLNIAKLPVWRS